MRRKTIEQRPSGRLYAEPWPLQNAQQSRVKEKVGQLCPSGVSANVAAEERSKSLDSLRTDQTSLIISHTGKVTENATPKPRLRTR